MRKVNKTIGKKDKRNLNSAFLIPNDIEAKELSTGVQKALDGVNTLLTQFIDNFNNNYDINEIELALSFNAQGQFLGISTGGTGTVTLRVKPKKK